MGQTQYGFVRDYGNAQAFDDYRAMGLGGLLYNVEDPRFEQGLQNAGQTGFQGGLWIPAHTGEDPIAYARRMAALAQKYHPSMLVPNVEFQGKGYEGSPGWNWSETMMNEFRRLSPEQQIAVSVMGNQDDFNYEAYTGRGAQVWAQAYDGAMHPWDTDTLMAQLTKRGVDPSRIGMTVAPGGNLGHAGNYSVYTLDDMNPAQRAQYIAQLKAAQARGEYIPGPGQSSPVGPNPVPDVLAKTNRNATDVRLLGANTTGHILTQKEINALTPKAVAVQTVIKPPTRARTTARKIVKKTATKR